MPSNTRHFKHYAESDHGVGIVHLELVDEWPSRQVEIYGNTWLWGDREHPENLADQPFDMLELGREHEISSDEFEQVWKNALERCPPRS